MIEYIKTYVSYSTNRYLEFLRKDKNMKCFKCGATVSDSARFCTSCGAKLSGGEQEVRTAQPAVPAQPPVPAQPAVPIQPAAPTQPNQPTPPPAQPYQPWQSVPPQQAPVGQPVPMQQPQQPQQPTYQAPAAPQQAAKQKNNRILPIVCISIAVAAVAALVIVLVMTNGGKGEDDSNQGGTAATESSSVITTVPETEAPEETEPPVTTEAEVTEATTPAETTVATTAQTTAPEVNEASSVRSTISGRSLKNDLFNIQVKLDSDWSFGSDAEVAELNGMTGSSAADFEKAIKENNMFYDAFAQKASGTNFIIVVPNPDKLSAIAASEKAYAEATLEGVKNIDGSAKITPINFAGKTHQSISITNSTAGVTFRQCMVFVKSGRYICMITFTCFSDEEIDEVMGQFSAIR